MAEQQLIQPKSSIQISYDRCCYEQGQVQAKIALNRGDLDKAFAEFHAEFGSLYNHTLISGGLDKVKFVEAGDALLLDVVLNWLEAPHKSIEGARGRPHYNTGVRLFRQLSGALAGKGVLR